MKIREVGKFKILDVIGQGSFGKVYKGIDRTNEEEVALKFITRKGKTKRELDNLRQEIQILKKLKHPNIIALKDHIETQNEFIVVTEFAGQDLSVVLEKESKFKTQKVRQYGSQILSALLYLNDNRIVHRDLKPQNILIKEGIIKICDFGFARKMSAMTMQLHSLKGTPLYIAPEIVSERPYNHKVDVWSLGIILFELAVGRPPFYAESYHKLIPKILNDKVRYPKDMDVSLRDLIDGMLQKTPSSRYDWNQIINHPFMKAKSPLNEVPNQPNSKQEKNQDEFEEYFPIDPKNFRSSALMNNKDRVEINQLKKYEEDIKQGKEAGKELKTNIIFYHQLISLFAGYAMGEIVSKQYIGLAMRILSRLVSQVKLEGDLRDDDITKKPDLLNSIISMIPNIAEDEILAQTYLIVGYLLKCNFDSLSFDLDCSERFVFTAKQTLEKANLDKGVYSNIIKVLGILAAQSLITLKNSQEFFEIVANSQILYLLAHHFVPEKETALLLFECLVKFIHPSKGEEPTKTPNFVESITQLKMQVGEGFQSCQKCFSFFSQMAETYPQSQLTNFNATFYQCVKFSSKFRGAFTNSKYIAIFQRIPIYNIPMAYYMMKFQGKQVINTNIIKMQISQETEIENPLHRAFEINFLILCMNSKAEISAKLEQVKFYLHKIAEVLRLEETKKVKSIENLEGWAFGCLPYKFDDIIVSAFMQLHIFDRGLEKQFIKTCQDLNIFENMVRVTKEDTNVSIKYFIKLLPFFINHYRESTKPSKKLIQVLSEALLLYLCPEEIAKIKANQQNREMVISYLQNCFILIDELASKDDKKFQDFFLKAENIGLHRLLMDEDLMVEKLLPYSLKLLYKMIQKSPPAILDFVAVYGLTKLSKYFKQTPQSITLEIIQIISHLARAKSDYYPNIASLKIVELIPKWLSSDNQQLTYRTLNLVGNLAKHSTFFFEEFAKYKVIPAIVSTIHYTKNFEKNVIYAIGNISFYNEQFKEDIKPLIPYLSKTLDLEDQHLRSNSISTLSNLLRHSNHFIKDIIISDILGKILQTLARTKNPNLTQFALNFLLKAVNYKQITSRQDMRESIKASLRKIVCAMDSEVFKKMQKIQDKLG